MHTAVVRHKAAWRLKESGGQQKNGLTNFSMWFDSIS